MMSSFVIPTHCNLLIEYFLIISYIMNKYVLNSIKKGYIPKELETFIYIVCAVQNIYLFHYRNQLKTM